MRSIYLRHPSLKDANDGYLWRPDRRGSHKRMKRSIVAIDVLADPERLSAYDLSGID
jgi:hypothetical protein